VSSVLIAVSVFEQQADIKFSCKLGKSATETHVSFSVGYADDSLKNSSVYDWYTNLKMVKDYLKIKSVLAGCHHL
jgi:hypothetical protein